MLKIKTGLIDKIIGGLEQAMTMEDGLCQLLGHQVEMNDSGRKWIREGEQQVYDLVDLITKYGNKVSALSVLLEKLLTLPLEDIKQLTPQFQEFRDNLTKLNQTLFEEQKDEGDCETND